MQAETASAPQWMTTGQADPAKLTPVMRQVYGYKQAQPDCLIFFRLGDFYELFFEDAIDAAPLLDMVLTSRNKRDPRPIPMCGFPYHAMASYVQRAIDAGRRVAVIEQLEDAKKVKGPVKRGLTRVITPGVLLESEALDGRRANNVVALVRDRGGIGVAVADASTGDFGIADVAHVTALSTLLVRLEPREIVAPESLDAALDAIPSVREIVRTHRTPERDVMRRLGEDRARLAGELMRAYLAEVRPSAVGLLGPPRPIPQAGCMRLDRQTVQHLELLTTVRTGRRDGSLLNAVDRCVSAAGARMLRSLLLAPLADRRALSERHAAVEALVLDGQTRREVRDLLGGMGDLARIVGRAAARMATPKELVVGRETLRRLPTVQGLLRKDALRGPALQRLHEALGGGTEALQLLQQRLAEEPGANVGDGGVIADGVCTELDELRTLCSDSDDWLQTYEAEQQARTSNPKLRAKFHRVAGYIIEISRARSDDVPDDYRRVGTLKNVERFQTPELREFETKMLTAEDRRLTRETTLYDELLAEFTTHAGPLRAIAAGLAEIDVHAGFAELAADRGYCRPELHDEITVELVACRHPVVENMLAHGQFVANDIMLGHDATRVMLLTGPNMAGKSTLMRQVALASILGQAGGFVPAQRALLPVFDAVMTRIGASDDISEGASTFMVEMRETAQILEHATPRSLIVLDEVGRGTSTQDGLSIAWAVVEAIHDDVGALCLFATHYHELTALDATLPHLANAHVAVKEWGDDMVFVYRLQPGPTNRSHGIAVARLAGLPDATIARARRVLENLERAAVLRTATPRQLGLFDAPAAEPPPVAAPPEPVAVDTTAPLDPDIRALLTDLGGHDLDDLSPRQAFAVLDKLVRRAREIETS